MTSVLQSAKEIFSWAKAVLPGGCQIEVFLGEGRGRSVVWSEGKCEDIHQSDGGGVGVRVILNGGGGGNQGYAYTTALARPAVEAAARRAADCARALAPDPCRELPRLSRSGGVGPLADPSAFSAGLQSIRERLAEGEARLLKKYPLLRSVLRASFGEGSSETAVVNSHGVEAECRGTYFGLGVSCLAEKEGERQEGGFGLRRRFQADLDWDLAFEEGARRTLALLGGKPIPSGKVAVVFDPAVACDFLSLVSGAVSADSVQKGKSFLAGKIGEPVAARGVSIIDDGRLPRGLASAPVDDEGVPTQTTAVISAGRLEHYLYDTYTARKDGTASTGNACRSGFKSSPVSGPSNFYLAAGSLPRARLLAETSGLYLLDVMGLHMADPISGEFSLAAIGARLEKGEFTGGVRGITLAGDLQGLLLSIDAVCDDLTFFGALGSPTFRAAEMTVSGA